MKHLSLVLWVLLWPIVCALETYIWVIIRNKLGHRQSSEEELIKIARVEFFTWIIFATYLLFSTLD